MGLGRKIEKDRPGAVPLDYGDYRFTFREYLMLAGRSAALSAAAGWLFYESSAAVLILLVIIFLLTIFNKERFAASRRWQLNLEFRDALSGMSAALSAGYSADNALSEALKALRALYPENALIIREFQFLGYRMKNGETAEEVISDLAGRSGVEDIRSFAAVFAAARKSGGNMVRILQRSIDKMGRKIEAKREIRTYLASRRYETLILKGMPFGILAYLRLCSPGFLNPMYHNSSGALIMTILLAMYFGCCALADRIMEIEV